MFQLDNLQVYKEYCSRQGNAVKVVKKLTEESHEFRLFREVFIIKKYVVEYMPRRERERETSKEEKT